MSMSLLAGILLGLMLGTGLYLLATQLPWLRTRDLGRRVDPYLRRSRTSSLFAAPTSRSRARIVVENLFGPVATRGLGLLERLTGGAEQLERRLRLAGRRTSTDSFRIEQVVFGAVGLVLGIALAVAEGWAAFVHPRSGLAAREGITIVNVGNGHTVAALVYKGIVRGVYEHHTGMRSLPEILSDLEQFRKTWLPAEEVQASGGHGTAFGPYCEEAGGYVPTFILGPRREMLAGQGKFLSPHGDMMQAGSFGLLWGWARRQARQA